MRTSTCILATAGFLAALAVQPKAYAVSKIQIDSFQDGTTQNWTNGGPATDPVNVSTGGPLGSGDKFLEASSTGTGGAGSKMVIFDRASEWSGDYIAAGIDSITLDLKSFDSSSATTLSIRIAFKSGISSSSPGYVSTTAFSLPTDGAWHHAVFSLTSTAMTGINSPAAFNSFFSGSGPVEFRILDNPSPSLDGASIHTQLGVDNVATAPEPGTVALMALPVAALFIRGMRKRKR